MVKARRSGCQKEFFWNVADHDVAERGVLRLAALLIGDHIPWSIPDRFHRKMYHPALLNHLQCLVYLGVEHHFVSGRRVLRPPRIGAIYYQNSTMFRSAITVRHCAQLW